MYLVEQLLYGSWYPVVNSYPICHLPRLVDKYGIHCFCKCAAQSFEVQFGAMAASAGFERQTWHMYSSFPDLMKSEFFFCCVFPQVELQHCTNTNKHKKTHELGPSNRRVGTSAGPLYRWTRTFCGGPAGKQGAGGGSCCARSCSCSSPCC